METNDLLLLTNLIQDEIKQNFKIKHMSGNLANTMEVFAIENGFEIHIPAEIYNMYQFQMHGVIIPLGKGSYASELDEEGSKFYSYKKGGRVWKEPGNHIDYLQNSIDLALIAWSKEKEWQIQIQI